MEKLFILIVFVFASNAGRTQNLTGRLTDAYNIGVPFQQVVFASDTSQIKCVTDSDGYYGISLTSGVYAVTVRVTGFKTYRDTIRISDTLQKDIVLQEDMLGLDEVVVSGTMRETYLSKSAVKIEVITSEHILKNAAPTNLMQSIYLINGLQEVVACGVCYTNSISVNGLPGAYTAILMDGTPMYGNLASVYGLNGIPIQIVDRIEVIRGPSSTLYGSEAVAGVINVITKDPSKQPTLSIDLMGTSHQESFLNAALTTKRKKWSAFTGINHTYINKFYDHNEDYFGDAINMDRYSLFSKWKRKLKHGKHWTIAGKLYYEDRRNGVEEYMVNRAYRTLRGNDSIYGESIYTKRGELFGTFEFPLENENIRLDYSLSKHFQDSYYGSDHYVAEQEIIYSNLIWDKMFGDHALVGGITNRLQKYDDNTVATETVVGNIARNDPDNQIVTGIFLQDEWQVIPRMILMPGIRLDYYNQHGFIPAPRFNVKYDIDAYTSARFNFGTGFRIVNLFTEDHAFISGQREVILADELRPESSYNVSTNLNHVYKAGEGSGVIDVDAYYTYFLNKIIPDYGTPGQIIYNNTNGYAVSYGGGVSITHGFSFPARINAGFNLQNVYEYENMSGVYQKRAVEFAAKWTGVLTANYDLRKIGLTFSYTARFTGPMALPELYDVGPDGSLQDDPRPTISSPFSVHNCQIEKQFRKSGIRIYMGVQNIFNTIQQLSPMVGYNDPNAPVGFSPYFDTAYAYRSTHGRELYAGLRWNFSRK